MESTTEDSDPDSQRMPAGEFIATGYCGLCRSRLPHNPLPGVDLQPFDDWEDWECDLRAVLCLDTEAEASFIITDRFSVSSHDFGRVIEAKLSHPIVEKVKVYFRIASLTSSLAFCFHDWCYTVLRWKIGACDSSVLYRLTKALSHESSPWETIGQDDGWIDPPSRIQVLLAGISSSTKLQPLLMAKLPTELRVPIWGYVGARAAYSSFLLVAEEASRLTSYLRDKGIVDLSLRKGVYLSSENLSIFGTSYIRTLDIDGESSGAVPVLDTVTQLKVIASLSGICAIKLIGSKWESDWIGKVPVAGQIWYGATRTLHSVFGATFSNLNCLDLAAMDQPQIMWDRPDFPANLIDPHIMSCDAVWTRGRSFSRFEFHRYLPLYSGKNPAEGLTIYCSNNGIVGLRAHFSKSTHSTGSQNGVPIYFPFKSGEEIQYIWYRLGLLSADPPTLVLQTTLGKSHHFGPYIRPDLQAQNCRWALLNTHGSITGLFYRNPRREIYRLSISGNDHALPRPTTAPRYPTCHQLPGFGSPGFGLFLSVAKFDQVQKIDLCCIADRCTGLLIHYLDNNSAALGQWYPENSSQHSSIYQGNGDKTATKIHFRMAYTEEESIVTEITVTTGEVEGNSDVGKTFDLGEYIAWWFSVDNDEILLWEEEYYDIPPEHHVILE